MQDQNVFIGEVNGKRYYLASESEKRMTWHEARAWCASLGNNFELPSRIVMLMCYNNEELRKQFKTDDYYWSDDVCEHSISYGWSQYFANSRQHSCHKATELYVRAVRVE